MSTTSLRSALGQVLGEVQAASNFECPEISDDTIPLRDLPGFDSLSGVDAEVRLSQRLGIEIANLPLKSPKDGHELSIGEIVSILGDRYPATRQS